MRQKAVAFFCLLAIAFLILSLTSCKTNTKETSGTRDTSKSSMLSTKLPKSTYIDDYYVRFVPRIVSYPKSLPILSLEKENFTDKEVLSWFGQKDVNAKPKIEKVELGTSIGPNSATESKTRSYTNYIQRSWQISDEETGVVSIVDEKSEVGFNNPKDLRSYGVLPHGIYVKGQSSSQTMTYINKPIKKDAAINEAEEYAKAHGGIPKDATRMIVEPIEQLYGREAQKGKIDKVDEALGYHIMIGRRFSGIPVDQDAITLAVDKDGVQSFSRTWHKLATKALPMEIISPRKAADIALQHYMPRIRSRYGIVVSQVRLFYVNPRQINRGNLNYSDELRPCWFLRITGEEARVDAITGELYGLDWEPGVAPTVTRAMMKYEKYPLSKKIPVPRKIVYIQNGRVIWTINPKNPKFGPILTESQRVLSKLRPFYKKKADLHGASKAIPRQFKGEGLLLLYGGLARLVTDSKVGRDFDRRDIPTDERLRRSSYTRDGHYRVITGAAFIILSDTGTSASRSASNKELYGDDQFTKVLVTAHGNKYNFIDAVSSNDKLREMAHAYSRDPVVTSSDGVLDSAK